MSGLLHDGVVEAARSRPDALAVIGEDGTFTYAELDDYSNRLASLLRDRGCGRGHRVALLMPNSARAVATLVGVLKAGSAYVPLDPAGGMERVVDMLRQCHPKLLLAGGCSPETVAELVTAADPGDAALGWLGPEPPPPGTDFTLNDVLAAPAGPPRYEAGPDDLAYILFTSGTTGSPKGVPIRHRSARAFTDWAVEHFGLGPQDRLSGHTALTFDLSVFDIFVTFRAGAELHLVPPRTRLMPHEVARFIEERKLTLWFSVPSQLAYVAHFDALGSQDLTSLRHVVWCGDVLSAPSLLYWKRTLPGVTFTNLYGPTETTVASSYYVVPESFDDPTASIPIGAACAGEELLVLDENLVGVPEGAVGDLYIGGVGLSPGYWRDPVRTDQVFLPDPRSPHGPERLYRTGDRGRVGPDGAVEFLGRADFQIKTAGYRVEPAEVESAVLALPAVTACVVAAVTVDDFSGSAIGCVYVPAPDSSPRVGEMKRRLGRTLPSFMVPSRWLAVDRLPLDGRGKVDRVQARALLEASVKPARRSTQPPHPVDELLRT